MSHPAASAVLTLACTAFAGQAWAQAQDAAPAPTRPALKPLDDAELSGVWGQALLDLTNTSQGGYDFSRITLNADITMSASLSGLKLGTNGGTSNIDISTLNFGRSDATDAQRTVAISKPYFEWVYSGAGTANAQVIGMRIGFGGIAGDVGLMMNTVSGSLSLSTPSSGQASGTGSQLTSLATTSGATLALNQIGGVTAGNSVDGPSRDFFLSILKQAITYPTTNGVASATAQAGFWLNWTDRLAALNTTGTTPPNVPKIGP